MRNFLAVTAITCVLASLSVPSWADAPGGPVQVYILAGQSNMQGHGTVNVPPDSRNGGKGTLEYLVRDAASAGQFRHTVNQNGDWRVRDDVWIWSLGRTGGLSVGYGAGQDKIGPEFQFGHVMGDHVDNPVLLIKTAWGGKSLNKDFRPPSSGGEVGPYYTQMIQHIKEVLADIKKHMPSYAGQGYMLSGFGWHQGWNDRIDQKANDAYEENMVNFIHDVRQELGVKNLPFVIAETGMTGPEEKHPRALSLMKAQADVARHKAFKGNVAFVGTKTFWRPKERSPSGQGYHWNSNAETYFLIGDAMAWAMLDLEKPSSLVAQPLPVKPVVKSGNPDFTLGHEIPEGAVHDWNLGATGARGWMFSDKMVTSDARQIRITEVEPGSPADGILEVGDVILGVGGKPFSYDPRTELGKALTVAESNAGGGRLPLLCWRDGKTGRLALRLPVLGSYSATAPYNCPKSKRILEQGCEALAKRVAEADYKPNPITRSLNALALLASGKDDYIPLVRKEAQWAADYSVESFQTWYYGYVIMWLSEYVMATGDESVMPGLRRLVLETANGQSGVGSWGHGFRESNGRLGGYGMMNAPGLPLTSSLVLAYTAGVKDAEVARAIHRNARLIRFYIGKGAVPYGDHHPWIQTHEDNGKCGMAAVLFNLMGEAEGTAYFSRMSVASHGAERDSGHTGNFWNMLWSLPGVAQSGPRATGAWMEEFGAWYFDLARCWDGTFRYQGAPEMRSQVYSDWDCTGAYLLSYALPLRKLYLTGRRKHFAPQVDVAAAQSLIEDGRGWSNKDRNSAYDALSADQLLSRLGSWSPVVRERAAMALGRRKDDVTPQLIRLLNASDLYTRLGACQALKMQKKRGASAVSALRRTLRSDDLWLRVLAADALAGIGEPAREAVPDMLTQLTKTDSRNDPRNMEQRYFCFALFNRGDGLIGKSLDGIERELLMKAVRAGLLNEDGRARGSIKSVYQNLSYDELEPLLPAIHRAIAEPAPSGIMFNAEIQMAGLELFAKHRISEGMELLVDFSRNQKKHGSEQRLGKIMDMLKTYGVHGKRVVRRLEATAKYFEGGEPDYPGHLSKGKAKLVRETIQDIKASTDEPELIYLSRRGRR